MNFESSYLIQICSMYTGQIVILIITILTIDIRNTLFIKRSEIYLLFLKLWKMQIRGENKPQCNLLMNELDCFLFIFVIFAMIIAVQKMTHIPLSQSLKIKGKPQREEIFKQTDPHFRQKRPVSHISNTCITKTIASCTVMPEKIPKAIEQRQYFKSIAHRPFFSKNRKMAQLDKKERKNSKSLAINNSDMCIMHKDFTQILKAKSTVIKQKKLQEFYINREGRRQEGQEGHAYGNQNFKSNLFKPYFPKKSHKMRRNSFFLEKSFKVTDSIEVFADHFKIYNRNTLSFAENLMNEPEDYALKQKQTINTILNKITVKKPNNIPEKEKIRLRQRWRQKQNLQFQLQPWGNIEADQSFF